MLSYHFLELVKVHQFPSPVLFLQNYLSFSYPPPFLPSAFSSWVMEFPFFLSISPAFEFLSNYHDCELSFAKLLPSFSYFRLPSGNYPLHLLVDSTGFLITIYFVLLPFFLKPTPPPLVYCTCFFRATVYWRWQHFTHHWMTMLYQTIHAHELFVNKHRRYRYWYTDFSLIIILQFFPLLLLFQIILFHPLIHKHFNPSLHTSYSHNAAAAISVLLSCTCICYIELCLSCWQIFFLITKICWPNINCSDAYEGKVEYSKFKNCNSLTYVPTHKLDAII